MAHLIDKDALVAEIYKLKKSHDNWSYMGKSFHRDYETLLSFIDTLEVKEVDLEKIINDYFKDWKFDDELDIMVKPNNYSASFIDLKDIAKHFFELGFKAQKGE